MLYVAILIAIFIPSQLLGPWAETALAPIRVGVVGLCFLGLIGIAVHKRLSRASRPVVPPQAEVPGSGPPLDEPALRLAYQTTADNSWRCTLDELFHQNVTALVLFAFSLPLALAAVSVISKYSQRVAILSFPLLCALGFAFWIAMFIAGTRHQLGERFPSPDAVRKCTAILTAPGFHDVTPDRVHFFPWSKVTSIREHRGDVFVRGGLSGGCFIPREAFADRAAALRFCQAARTLRRSRGATWPGEDLGSFATGIGASPRFSGSFNPCMTIIRMPRRETKTRWPMGPADALANHLAAVVVTFVIVFLLGSLISVAFWVVG